MINQPGAISRLMLTLTSSNIDQHAPIRRSKKTDLLMLIVSGSIAYADPVVISGEDNDR